jgi:hypothetical protein
VSLADPIIENAMRNITRSETPSLFPPEMLVEPVEAPPFGGEATPARQAREFVRWCWSVGDGFRNSPDRMNLRYWQHKNRMKSSPAEEDEILAEARSLFLRKAEQAARKADVAQQTD